MAFFECSVLPDDSIYVEDEFDSDGELLISIEETGNNSSVALNRGNAKKLAEHLLQLLEESK